MLLALTEHASWLLVQTGHEVSCPLAPHGSIAAAVGWVQIPEREAELLTMEEGPGVPTPETLMSQSAAEHT